MLTILVRNRADQDPFGVHAYDYGETGEAYTERKSQVADGINVWWMSEVGNNTSRWCDSRSIEKFLKLFWRQNFSWGCHRRRALEFEYNY